MKKKNILLILSAFLLLTGCGKNDKEEKGEIQISSSIEENISSEENKNTTKEVYILTEDLLVFSDPSILGSILSNSEMDYKVYKTGTGENGYIDGPFKIYLTGASMGEFTPKSEELKNIFGKEKNKPAIMVSASVENTGENAADLAFDQASLSTNTGENLEAIHAIGQWNQAFEAESRPLINPTLPAWTIYA